MIYSIISIITSVQLMAAITNVSAEVPFGDVEKGSGSMFGKFLIPLPPFGKSSHDQTLEVLTSELAERGHTIHLLANGMSPRSLASFGAKTMIEYETSITAEDRQKLKDDAIKSGNRFGGLKIFRNAMQLMSKDCKALLTDTNTLTRLRDENYNLIIADVFSPCEVLLAHHLDIPFVALTTTREYPLFRKSLYGFPAELSYCPESLAFFGSTDRMTFVERLRNVIYHIVFSHVMPSMVYDSFIQLQQDLGIKSGASLANLMSEAVLWLSYSDLSIDYPQPSMPNYVPIGGMTLKEAKSLEKVSTFLYDFDIYLF